MSRNGRRAVVVAVALLAAICFQSAMAAGDAANDAGPWLRGAGSDLQLRLSGEVFDEAGRPATDFDVSCQLHGMTAGPDLKPAVNGNRFEIWIPVNAGDENLLLLKASSSHDNSVACQRLSTFEFRQSAIDGLQLKLTSPNIQKRFLVRHNGQPVADADVKVEFGFGSEARARTDAGGVATFELLLDQTITRVTAWTNDRRIGGYSFDRQPTHDPSDDEFEIELSGCRDQLIRFVDESGQRVGDVEATVQIATPDPNYNFVGTNENSRIKSNAAGQVVYPWFPDWDRHHFYVDLNSRDWMLVGEPELKDDVYVIRLTKRKPRQRVAGRITSHDNSLGGFLVTLDSFQGERENYRDLVSVFTDPDGSFTVDVLPDATYCAWVLDARWVSEIIDLIPYDSELEHTNSPQLAITPGERVEIVATLGPKRQPYANLPLYFSREHDFQWRTAGGSQRGSGGPQWWAFTDGGGRAYTYTAPGKLNANVYTPKWRSEQEVDVRAGQPTTVTLHREAADPHSIRGRVVVDGEMDVKLADIKRAGVELQAAAIDGQYSDQQEPTCQEDGSFSFESIADRVGVFAATPDGKLAGAAIVTDFDTPCEVNLLPTVAYEGQLLVDDRQPLVGHRVFAVVRVGSDRDSSASFPQTMEVKRVEIRTDDAGNFSLAGLPCRVLITIYGDPIDGTSDLSWIDEVFLEPGDARPRTVSRLQGASISDAATPLADRFSSTLRDCRLGGFVPLVILHGSGATSAEFVEHHFVDYLANPAVSSFMPIAVDTDAAKLPAEDADYIKQRDWKLPAQGQVVVRAFDTNGRETSQLELDVRDKASAAAAADFIKLHAPPRQDAEEKWKAAFAAARKSDRRVLARVSQRYCGPCFALSRWLDDQHTLLEKDYVLVKIDDVRDLHGREVANRLTRGKRHGVPFFAIFAADEKLLVDSAGPLGNIGYPAGRVESQRHLRQMLESTRQQLTDAQIETLIDSLNP